MVKISNFPHLKTLADFEFSFQPQINEVQINNLASLGFMERAENIVFLGSSGVRKTRLATSLGIESSRNRRSTYFIKYHDLIQNLKRAKDEVKLFTSFLQHTCFRYMYFTEVISFIICVKHFTQLSDLTIITFYFYKKSITFI